MFECKSEVNKGYIAYAEKKVASVRGMTRTSVAISHVGGTFQPKPHFRILAGLLAPRSSWGNGLDDAFLGNLSSDDTLALGCVCALDHVCYDRYDGDPLRVSEQGAMMFFLFRLIAGLKSWERCRQLIGLRTAALSKHENDPVRCECRSAVVCTNCSSGAV
ncbi:hypothetical protein PHO31112_02323 [Pandoraea horticolens]|uniref:Uncharacterized protein n=1 Tax=Pandoraea horticolens TaxID=2508298 RepID=A0A5E4UXP5_9BURK|nr:hypothetical protein PHO31112_02323 [Pandoraea horticolens]